MGLLRVLSAAPAGENLMRQASDLVAGSSLATEGTAEGKAPTPIQGGSNFARPDNVGSC
jgi:hypothetical protein